MQGLRTFVVNLEKDIDKCELITSQLDEQNGLDWEILKACYGKELSIDSQKQLGYDLFRERYGRSGTLPAFGCSVSHCMIYTKMISDLIPVSLIIEDDAILSPNLITTIGPIVDIIDKSDEPIVVLLTPDFTYLCNSPKEQIDNGHILTPVINGYMTSGYLINLQAAKLLYQIQSPITYVADAWSDFAKRGLKIMGVLPHVISYPDGLGEIGHSQRPDNEPLYLVIRHKLGRAKAKLNSLIQYSNGYRKSKKQW